MQLNFDITFQDLYQTSGLKKIDGKFLDFLEEQTKPLKTELLAARNTLPSASAESKLFIELSPYLEEFIFQLFKSEQYLNIQKEKTAKLDNLFRCKRLFVQRKALKKYKLEEANTLDSDALRKNIEDKIGLFNELNFANYVSSIENEEDLETFAKYAAWATLTKEGKEYHKNSIIFSSPQKLDFENLLDLNKQGREYNGHKHHLETREGFKLTSKDIKIEQALAEANYCIFCHERERFMQQRP